MLPTKEQFYAEFERAGEEAVRDGIVSGAYQNKRVDYALQWLGEIDEARREASNAEDRRTARSAKNAAWAAAIAAIIAAIAAAVAAVIAYRALPS